MDGSNGYTTLVNTSAITVITIDHSQQTLYWYSGYELGSVDTDGSNILIISRNLTKESSYYISLSHLDNSSLYYTYLGSTYIFLVKSDGKVDEVPERLSPCHGLAGLKVISQGGQPVQGRVILN